MTTPPHGSQNPAPQGSPEGPETPATGRDSAPEQPTTPGQTPPGQAPFGPGAVFGRSYDDLRRGARTALIIQGVLSIIMGVLFLAMPGVTAIVFGMMFAIWIAAGGVMSLIGHFSRDKEHRSGWTLAGAILSIIAGIVAFVLPGAATLALALVVGFWALVAGVTGIVSSFSLRKMGAKYWWTMLINGIVGVLVGIVFVVSPAGALVSLAWVLGIFAIVDGIAEIVLGIRMKKKQPTA